MTSKSSGKEPPSVASVITCPPVRFDGSSSVSAQRFGLLRRARCHIYPRARKATVHGPILVPSSAPAGTDLGQPDESRYHPYGSGRNDLCVVVSILYRIG